jgi:predicted Zn-dependent protease
MGVRRAVALLALAAAAACDAPTVPSETPGYDPRLPLASGDVIYHWPLGYTIAVYAHTAGAPAGFDMPAAILRANEVWRNALRYREFDVRLVATPAEADVVFHFDTDSVVSVTSCAPPPTGAAGITSACPNAAGTALDPIPLIGGGTSRVKFDVQISASPVRIPNATAFQRIVAHEFGHVIGIGRHSGDMADLMFGGPQVDVPSDADAQTLRYVLHQPAQLRP